MNFTKDEYAVLIKSIFMAEWMVTAIDVAPHPEHKPFTALFQKIYDSAKDMGCEELVDYLSTEKRFQPANSLWDDAIIRERIDHYNNSTFWEELIARMSERDLARQGIGLSSPGPMTDAQISALADLEEYYGKEFKKHDLSRVTISN
jgi:hypothetical protein